MTPRDEVIKSAEMFWNSSHSEEWFFLAHAGYIEMSKMLLRDLIDVANGKEDGFEISLKCMSNFLDVDPAFLEALEMNGEMLDESTHSLTGNVPGGIIFVSNLGPCQILKVLPPKQEGEIERLLVQSLNGTQAELGIKQVNIGGDIIQ